MTRHPSRVRATIVAAVCALPLTSVAAAPALAAPVTSVTPAAPAASACPAATLTPIPTVQGPGAASPLVGKAVTVRGVVVADLRAGGFGGYFVQDPAGDRRADTSDAVFVYAPNAAARVGDVVQASGTVTEFKGLTEIGGRTALATCGRAALPAPTPLRLPADPTRLEALEGMRVAPAGPLTVTDVHGLDRYGEVVLSAGGRESAPTEVAEPGAPARAVAAQNARRRIVLDDAYQYDAPHPGLYAPDPYRSSDHNPALVGLAMRR